MGKPGRPKGRKNDKTLEKERVQAAVQQRIFKMADSLINAQATVAKGQHFLYKIHTDSKGKRGKPELVTDPGTIAAYLDGEFGDGESISDNEDYYYISVKEANHMAAADLLNRALGKPKESIEHSGDLKLGITQLVESLEEDGPVQR